MIKNSAKKGFTLIELLLVIAIIGILASALLVSLGGARRAARDSRRISDLRQVQSALELYFNACGHYPGTADCASKVEPADWTAFALALTDGSLGISKIPNDPLPSSAVYYYAVEVSANQNYVLRAVLETNNPALSDDIENTDLPGNYQPSTSASCDDDLINDIYNYCVGI